MENFHPKINDQNFETVIKNTSKLMLVLFMYGWKGSCYIMKNLIDEAIEEMPNVVKFFQYDCEKNRKQKVVYNIYHIPTLLFLRKGVLLDKLEGIVPKSVIQEKLKKFTPG